jgi:LPS export ABC transporter protein LptC
MKFFPLLFGGLLLAVATSGCLNDPEEVADLMARLNPQVETATDVAITYSDSAVLRGFVSGPTMLNYLDNTDLRQEFPDGVHVVFFDDQGDTTSILDAQLGIRRERKNEIIVRDSVVWYSLDGQRLETDELIWDQQMGEISTNKFVVITTPEQIIYGHGFRADQDFRNARILSVEGRVQLKKPLDGPSTDRPTPLNLE